MTEASLEAVHLPIASRVTPLVALVRPHPFGADLERPDQIDRFGTRPRWSTFRYSAPGPASSSLRASVWRELQAMGALKLQPSVWAVAHRDDGRTELEQLAGRVRAAGHVASIAEVDHVVRLDVGLQSQLDRSCERLWDELLNAIDWFESQVETGALSPDERAIAFDDLRALYASTLPRDLVGSAACRHAAGRLHRLADAGSGDRPDGLDGLDGLDKHDGLGGLAEPEAFDRHGRGSAARRGRFRHRVAVDAEWRQRDGATMLTTRLHPMPDRSWEGAFHAFESWAYRPSTTRPPLEHGMVRGSVPSGDVEGAVARIEARVTAFESSLDHR